MTYTCRLCLKNTDLKISHIIPKFFYKEIKNNSLTGKMRNTQNVNKPQQDGIKTQFLCQHCEELFSKYEKYFSENIYKHYINNEASYVLNSNNNELRYFILSLAWRHIQYYLELNNQDPNKYPLDITSNERVALEKILDLWRFDLLQEKHNNIKKKQMFIIPYDIINTTDITISNFLKKNSITPDFAFYNQENTFDLGLFFLKVPHLIFITTIWGHYDKLKSNQIGNLIKMRNTKFDKTIYYFMNKSETAFMNAQQQLSETQIQETIKRALKVSIKSNP